jgi:hypothetical protein
MLLKNPNHQKIHKIVVIEEPIKQIKTVFFALTPSNRANMGVLMPPVP